MDSSIYVFRAWFTMPDHLTNLDGHAVNAFYGFSDFLAGLLHHEKPVYIACAFDESLALSYRNEIYPAYKANREPAPADLKRQFQFCRELVELAGIANFGSPRFEADDIIGTLSYHMRAEGLTNIIITADKDLTQLLQHQDLWWEYTKDQQLTIADVHKKFGVHPHQIADLLALAGDAVDNIPGIPGIGQKTAANLLTRFESVENLLNNIDKIGAMKFRGAERVQQLVQEHQDLARLSKKLTLIAMDDSLPKEKQALARKPYQADALEAFFERMNFGPHRRQRWHKLLSQ
ncbi:MAG: flap endonuclease [Gammaproteobacteria bacterium]|nr:flap endonuclease [Gammaproteobacteria bacterium]